MKPRDELIEVMARAYLDYEDNGKAEIMGRVQAAMSAALDALLALLLTDQDYNDLLAMKQSRPETLPDSADNLREKTNE